VALNDELADGRDVSWIWDVDFEPLLAEPALERIIASGERAAELALRFKYGGYPERSVEVVEGLEEALELGLSRTPQHGELVILPTYTAMLSLRDIVTRRGFVRPYWEERAA
jgi:UDP-N-acetylmuramyl tripeptide synthase